ncbi:MAG: glycoside hydrolase family 2 protein, partial [Clostridia bacterium]|nr:glycoside hydrolase family 2 protein [Clostridia bacterium]
PHGPIAVDDIVGQLLETEEGFDKAKAEMLRECLLAAKKYGLANLPLKDKARMGLAMTLFGMTFEDGVQLYNKYIGNWGNRVISWRYDALKDGEVVASRTCCPSTRLHLEAKVSHDHLIEGDTYDMALIRLRIADEFGNTASYAQLPLRLVLTGPAELVGPTVAVAEGGCTGTLIRTTGGEGPVHLTVVGKNMEPIELDLTVTKRGEPQ